MKRVIVLTVFLHAAIQLFAGGIKDGFSLGLPIKGNGNMVTSEKPVADFYTINISRNATVNYHESPEYRAVVTVDSNLNEFISVYTDNGTLYIGAKRGRHYLFTQYIVDVYAPSLEGVSISGSARFEGIDTISSSVFNLRISGSGKINGNFECNDFSTRISGSGDIRGNIICKNFQADISGSGDITLAGSCDYFNVTVTGAGDLNGREFMANNADVRISGSGRVNIWVVENLRANITGAGVVRYRGTPKIDFRGSGAGRMESE